MSTVEFARGVIDGTLDTPRPLKTYASWEWQAGDNVPSHALSSSLARPVFDCLPKEEVFGPSAIYATEGDAVTALKEACRAYLLANPS